MGDDLQRLGALIPGIMGRGMSVERRIAAEWPRAVGEEIARNAQPRSLRTGRLVVATSSSVWAQTLQLMGDQVVRSVNQALGEPLVSDVVFRPAGWDPGAGPGAPRPLSTPGDGAAGYGALCVSARDGRAESGGDGPGEGLRQRPRRLSPDEEEAIAAVRRLACDETLGEQIARTMRAYLERQDS